MYITEQNSGLVFPCNFPCKRWMTGILLSISRASKCRFYRYCSEFPRLAVKIFAFNPGKSSFLAGSFFLRTIVFIRWFRFWFIFIFASGISSPKPDNGSKLEKFSSLFGHWGNGEVTTFLSVFANTIQHRFCNSVDQSCGACVVWHLFYNGDYFNFQRWI